MTYGFRLPDVRADKAQELLNNSHGFFHLIVGSQVLDWYPSLRRLIRLIPNCLNPLARKAIKAYERERVTFTRYYERATEGTLPCELQSHRYKLCVNSPDKINWLRSRHCCFPEKMERDPQRGPADKPRCHLHCRYIFRRGC